MTNLDAAAVARASHPPPAPEDPGPVAPPREFSVHKRIAVLGARGVGKSALSIRCALNRFEPDYLQTFQDMYRWQPFLDGVDYDVSIDDTDGQNETSEFGLRYTTGVDGYVLMFSVRDENSFKVIKALNYKLLDTLGVSFTHRKGVAEVPRVLVGNQVDVSDDRQVPKHVAQTWADTEGIPYIESSAYTAYNAEEVFTKVLRIINQNLQNSHVAPAPAAPELEAPPSPKSPNNLCSVQ